jgi:[NiFe] hydrogenase diaphorase moiety large subunit
MQAGAFRRARALASVGFTSCTGLGDQGPALLLNQQQVLTRMDAPAWQNWPSILRAQVPVSDWPAEWMQVEDQVRRSDVLLGQPPQGDAPCVPCWHAAAQATLAEVWQPACADGAAPASPPAANGTLCRDAPVAPGHTRVVVCNADEGEPGTFKDRVLLSRQADAVFRRHDRGRPRCWARARDWCTCAANTATCSAFAGGRAGAGEPVHLLGKRILGTEGFDFDIDIHVGAGAYVCGEESALIESLEGKRGTPRIRPPFPVEQWLPGPAHHRQQRGDLLRRAHIALQGSAWWAAMWHPQSSGHQAAFRQRRLRAPGIYEYPLGVTWHRSCTTAARTRPQAVQVGGPSGVCLAAHEFKRRVGL